MNGTSRPPMRPTLQFAAPLGPTHRGFGEYGERRFGRRSGPAFPRAGTACPALPSTRDRRVNCARRPGRVDYGLSKYPGTI